ncbi:MAG TPA: Lrp/AsnC family transcriptional regulator [Novosphingobium sp.]|nr:Lrp/AsnC family transcriptional regulator [Novosphingobium sp.]
MGRHAIEALERACVADCVSGPGKKRANRAGEAEQLSPGVAAMEDAGVIARNIALVDTAAVGMSITAIVEVYLTDERSATVDAAKALFRDAPEVQQCYYVTGGTSFVLIVVAPDMVAYEAITRRLFAQNDAVESFRSLIALDRVKAGAEIVVP